jgi:hypothetical protein
MTPKPYPTPAKSSILRPVRKVNKGAAETARLFIDINESIRRTQTMRLSRYVE